MKNLLVFLLVAVAISSCHSRPNRHPENHLSMKGPPIEPDISIPAASTKQYTGPPGPGIAPHYPPGIVARRDLSSSLDIKKCMNSSS